MITLHPNARGTHATLSAFVLLTLGVSRSTPSIAATTRAPGPRAHDTISLGKRAEGRITARTTSLLPTPRFDAQTDAYAFAIDVHNASEGTADWLLGVELRSAASGAREVAVSASTTDGATWSAPLTIDTSGNPAFCVAPRLLPTTTQTVHFRVRTPGPADITHLSVEAEITQSSSRAERSRPRTRLLSRV